MHLGRGALLLGLLSLSGCASPATAPTPPKLWADPPVRPTPAPPSAAPDDVAGDAPLPVALVAAKTTSPTTARTCDAHPLCNGESCCTSIELPAGTYADDKAGSVRVAAFALDKYELTVGR